MTASPDIAAIVARRHSYAQRRFWDADDALWSFETPFYHYCATGLPVGGDLVFGSEWKAKRAQLEANAAYARRYLEEQANG